jgi:Flp pilus assembly protein TadG
MLHLSHWARRIRRNSSGQTTVLVAAASVGLLAAVGLAADVGSLRNVHQHMQSAADSAAIAAVEGLQTSQSSASDSALADAKTNGFEDGANGVSVTVENPPQGGSYQGNANYVRVVISQPEPTYFLKLLGLDSVQVSASASAHMGNSPYCVYSLDPSASGSFGTLTTNGGATLSAKCGIIVDSSSSSAVSVNGVSVISATQIGIVGSYSLGGGSVMTPTPRTNIVPSDDPLKNLAEPMPSTCTPANTTLNIGNDTTLYPGTYCGTNGKPAIKVASNANVTFNPGLYIIDGGGIDLSGGGTITGDGVTIFNTFDSQQGYGAINITGSGTVTLSAPTSGYYEGILFMDDRNAPSSSSGSKIAGGSASVYNGVLYFPQSSLTFTGNSVNKGSYTILVGDKITLSGASQLNDDYSMLADGSPIKGAALAE